MIIGCVSRLVRTLGMFLHCIFCTQVRVPQAPESTDETLEYLVQTSLGFHVIYREKKQQLNA